MPFWAGGEVQALSRRSCIHPFASAFVGLVVMILLFPIPGYVAKLIQTVQVERMKKVGQPALTIQPY